MTIPQRHAGAPWLPGETVGGPDLQEDIGNLFEVFGVAANGRGQLRDVNFSPSAGISGSKLLDASIATVKLRDNSIDGASAEDSAIEATKILDATVTGLALAVGSIWNVAQGYSGTQFATDATYEDAATVSLSTSPEASTVLIIATLEYQWLLGGDDMQVRIRRDSSDLRETDNIRGLAVGKYGTILIPWIDTGHSISTSHTWRVQVKQTGGTDGFNIEQAIIAVFELRR